MDRSPWKLWLVSNRGWGQICKFGVICISLVFETLGGAVGVDAEELEGEDGGWGFWQGVCKGRGQEEETRRVRRPEPRAEALLGSLSFCRGTPGFDKRQVALWWREAAAGREGVEVRRRRTSSMVEFRAVLLKGHGVTGR